MSVGEIVSPIHLSKKAEKYLQKLCLEISARRVGSEGNQAATDFFARTVASFGFQTECPEFDCIDWNQGGARLTVDDEPFEASVSPYSLGGHLSGPLIVASTVEELEAIEASHKIMLLRGTIAKEQLMPKNFTFYNPDHHQRIIGLLEKKGPEAIIAATSRDPGLAGGMYPFPLIEDGDFDIPSVYMKEEGGDRLAAYAGREITLDIKARRIPAKGCNVIARKGADSKRRIVVCAHIDAKDDTPGALDNGTGIVVLFLLAELLERYAGTLEIELVAINGEDYYSAPGEMQYLSSNVGRFTEIMLAINIDLAGFNQGNTAYSLYDCPAEIAAAIQKVFSAQKDTIEGEPWYQSDHSLFIQNQVPALAITSDRFMELSTYVTHTARDHPELVDYDKLVNVALALRDLLLDLQPDSAADA
jgi:aminopeptidase YwaD